MTDLLEAKDKNGRGQGHVPRTSSVAMGGGGEGGGL